MEENHPVLRTPLQRRGMKEGNLRTDSLGLGYVLGCVDDFGAEFFGLDKGFDL